MLTLVYPAEFYYDDTDGIEAMYSVVFPDFNGGATQGIDIKDAIEMGSDWLGIEAADILERGENLPKPSNLNEIELDKDMEFSYDKEKSFVSLVSVDVSEYMGQDELVKKTLSIPRWADRRGKELALNFSKALTEAILEKSVKS